IGPAAGQFTNNLFAWARSQGMCDERLATIDWRRVPELIAAGDLGAKELERARDIVAEFLAARTKAEVMAASLERRLLAAPVQTVADVAESPQLRARGFWVELGDGERRRVLPGPF